MLRVLFILLAFVAMSKGEPLIAFFFVSVAAVVQLHCIERAMRAPRQHTIEHTRRF